MINGMDYPIIRRMHLTVLLPPMISIMFFAMGHIKPRTLYAAVIDGEAVAVIALALSDLPLMFSSGLRSHQGGMFPRRSARLQG